jgi:LIVCS family branched-chain amino acid:cation transporter
MVGFFVTAVIVPFLGLLSMIIFEGKREVFFNTIGKYPGFILTLLMLALIGPFGVVPRCITVAFGGLKLVIPELSFALFSAFFCACICALIWRPNQVVRIIGIFITPFKLGGLAILILFGLYFAQSAPTSPMETKEALTLGFITGYQTMDLIAAFFFSAAIIQYLRDHLLSGESKSAVFRAALIASLIGAFLLAIVYFGFVSLGASYAGSLTDARPEALLAAIAGLTMGKYALAIVALTLAISCLATAVILSSLFVDFLRKDIVAEKMGMNLPGSAAIILTMAATFAISLLGFETICGMIGQVLELSYPAFIVLSLHHIVTYFKKIDLAKPLFWSVLLLTGVWKYFS